MVRGLDYYTHTVFEIEADIEGFGAQNVLGGGGRYQSLVKELGGPDLPGIGFAFGMERLIIAMESENITFEEAPSNDIFFIATDEAARVLALKLLFEARQQGMVADMDFVSSSFKAQLKSGLKSNAKYLGIIGESELVNKTISLKNTKTQQQEEIPVKIAIRSVKSWLGK